MSLYYPNSLWRAAIQTSRPAFARPLNDTIYPPQLLSPDYNIAVFQRYLPISSQLTTISFISTHTATVGRVQLCVEVSPARSARSALLARVASGQAGSARAELTGRSVGSAVSASASAAGRCAADPAEPETLRKSPAATTI